MEPSYQNYLESWTQELSSRALRVRHLIGSNHWHSDGTHKEHILRDFFSRYIPPSVKCTHGFVRTTEGACSNELDLMFVALDKAPPYFYEGDLSIVPPESVFASIEVKSKASPERFREVFSRHIRTLSLYRSTGVAYKPWHAGVFFDIPSNWTVDKLQAALEKTATEIVCKYGNDEPFCGHANPPCKPPLPTCIVIIDRYIVFFRTEVGRREFRLTIFDAGALSFALGAVDLLGHLYSHCGKTTLPTPLECSLEELDIPHHSKLVEWGC